MEPLREGLPPVVGPGAKVLVLGSFPSERSLEVGEYYANRRNQFWRILGELLAFDAAAPYAERVETLSARGVAMWDVIHRCRRAGSLDAKIDRDSVQFNDFDVLLTAHPGIERVFVNGATAFELYGKHVTLNLPAVRLPSSSGAAAAVPFTDKVAAWRAIV